MENLKRYTMVIRRDENGIATPALKIRQKGDVVKFSDIKDVLNSTPNNDRDSISEKYNELLMAVEDKFDGETRHETALKYIRFAQTIRTAGSSETKPVS